MCSQPLSVAKSAGCLNSVVISHMWHGRGNNAPFGIVPATVHATMLSHRVSSDVIHPHCQKTGTHDFAEVISKQRVITRNFLAMSHVVAPCLCRCARCAFKAQGGERVAMPRPPPTSTHIHGPPPAYRTGYRMCVVECV